MKIRISELKRCATHANVSLARAKSLVMRWYGNKCDSFDMKIAIRATNRSDVLNEIFRLNGKSDHGI